MNEKAQTVHTPTPQPTLVDWVFLATCAAAAGGILYAATSGYGIGVSSDSIFYMSGADSIVQGRGYLDFKGDPIVDFPPLYSLVLAILSWPSGISPFVWGRFLNVAITIGVVFSGGLLFRAIFPHRRLWWFLGPLSLAALQPMYPLAANIGSDMLFILLSIWFCLAAQRYGRSHALSALAVMTILSAAAPMLRWAGMALVAAQFVVLAAVHWGQWRTAALRALVSCGAAILPVGIWMLSFNLRSGQLMGGSGTIDILWSLHLSGMRLSEWIAPNPALVGIPLFAIFVLLSLIFNRRADWFGWLKSLSSPQALPMLALAGIYFLAVLTNSYPQDHLSNTDHRYQVPLATALLVVLFASVDKLLLAHLSQRTLWVGQALVILLCALWMSFQGGSIARFVHISRENGVQEYNVYNQKRWVRSGLVVALIKNPPPAGAVIYSNEPEAIYFFLRRSAYRSPMDAANYSADPVNAELYARGWSSEPLAYWAWFKPNIKRQYFSPNQLEPFLEMEKLYREWDGELYLIRPGG